MGNSLAKGQPCSTFATIHVPNLPARYPPDQLSEVEDSALNAGLGMGVVILDAVQQLAQAPIAVGLHRQQLRGGGRRGGRWDNWEGEPGGQADTPSAGETSTSRRHST